MKPQDQTKRILIISLFFKPDKRVGGKRFSFLSRILQKEYPELHVLTLAEKNIPQKDMTLSCAGTVHRVGMYPPHPIEINNIFKKIFTRVWIDYLCLTDPFSGWILPAVFKGLKVIRRNKIDLILATGPPFSSILVAFLLSLVSKTKLIIDYRDPWTNLNFKHRKIFRKRFLGIFEKLTIHRAAGLVFCSQKMKDDFMKSLGQYTHATQYVVTNGFYPRYDIKPLPLGKTEKAMVYAGHFYGQRSINLIIKPLVRLLDEKVITAHSFCFTVFGNLKEKDRQMIRKWGLQNIIKEHPQVPHETIIRYLKAADILFLPSGSEVSYAIPFKFYDYLSVRRPILAVAPENSAVAHMMNKIDCGRLASINREESIYKNLRIMLLENKEYTYYGADHYTWDKIAYAYTKVIDRVMISGNL